MISGIIKVVINELTSRLAELTSMLVIYMKTLISSRMIVGHCYYGRLGEHDDELLYGPDVELDPSWTLLLWTVRRAC